MARSIGINRKLLTLVSYVYKAVRRKSAQMRNSDSFFIKPAVTPSKCLSGNLLLACVGAVDCTIGRALVKPVIKGIPVPTLHPLPISDRDSSSVAHPRRGSPKFYNDDNFHIFKEMVSVSTLSRLFHQPLRLFR